MRHDKLRRLALTTGFGEGEWWKLRLKTLENGDYGSKYVAGVIGEKEGRKWLTEQGHEVFDFGRMAYLYFRNLEDAVDKLKRRRKQEYIEDDKIYISKLEHKLEGIFGEKFERMRQFFKAFYQLKEEVRKARKDENRVGIDFIVKKNNDFSFVEIKANQSILSKHQRMCFKIAKRFGFKTFVLRVKVESNIPKDICLIEF